MTFGRLPLPATLEVFSIDGLTAFRAPAFGAERGVALFVPGFTGSKEDHRFLVALAAEHGWESFSYSQRGQGDSIAPVGVEEYTLEKLAGDAVAVARRIANGRRVHLVGHSLGGLVARAAAIFEPGLFADVTMLCSGPGGQGPEHHQDDAAFVAAHGTLAWWEHNNPQGARDEDEVFVRERAAASSDDNFVGLAAILRDTEDSTDELRATGLPVLIAHGDADDAWPIASQLDMATRLGARYEVIPNAGHLPNIDNPTYTTELLDSFWSSDHPTDHPHDGTTIHSRRT
ncbi:alpha/beta fold hydrolase [Agreia sp. COWG]|uniref:alpha/beta fold hydrolase n=1 Tax=Agreia sp. COWG TaxID=2773266 RepID=UPI0019296D9C|nr:alpha/beta fold hydrolase [Agreia sp. COWG]CAD6002908.1 Pimeloyl-ACP methyl ester carboxylesterase [Agreia sp. COWG]